MKNSKIILFFALFLLALFIAIFFYGRHLGKQAVAPRTKTLNVNSQTIFDQITDQYFLVTKTVFADSKAEIETPKNNDWTDLFLGKKITVRGLVRIDVGVDMKNMRLENIVIDNQKKLVTITLPHAEILDASLSGQLDLDEDKAIVEKLKGFLQDTQNDDYNLALETLIEQAKSQVMANENIFTEAREDSIKLIELIVRGMLADYQLIIK